MYCVILLENICLLVQELLISNSIYEMPGGKDF